jgi:hypothetical protein
MAAWGDLGLDTTASTIVGLPDRDPKAVAATELIGEIEPLIQ